MYCEKCGDAMPGDSFVCPTCGKILSQKQIKIHKEMNKNNNQPKYLSDRYGVKKDIVFNKDFNNKNLIVYIIFILLILIIIALIAINAFGS